MAKTYGKRVEESAYPRYDWWNEMRHGWEGKSSQPVQLTFGQVEMLQRNRLDYLMVVAEGKTKASPFVTAPSIGCA